MNQAMSFGPIAFSVFMTLAFAVAFKIGRAWRESELTEQKRANARLTGERDTLRELVARERVERGEISQVRLKVAERRAS